jgi:hypothetical protein
MVLGSVRPVELQAAAGEVAQAAADGAATSDKLHASGNSKQQQQQQQSHAPVVSSIPGPSPGAAKKQVGAGQRGGALGGTAAWLIM